MEKLARDSQTRGSFLESRGSDRSQNSVFFSCRDQVACEYSRFSFANEYPETKQKERGDFWAKTCPTIPRIRIL